jgi:hypothetical protein
LYLLLSSCSALSPERHFFFHLLGNFHFTNRGVFTALVRELSLHFLLTISILPLIGLISIGERTISAFASISVIGYAFLLQAFLGQHVFRSICCSGVLFASIGCMRSRQSPLCVHLPHDLFFLKEPCRRVKFGKSQRFIVTASLLVKLINNTRYNALLPTPTLF